MAICPTIAATSLPGTASLHRQAGAKAMGFASVRPIPRADPVGVIAVDSHLGAELFESSFAEDSASKKDDDEKVVKKWDRSFRHSLTVVHAPRKDHGSDRL